MLEAANYSVFEALLNGRRVEIRALRPDDRADLIAAVGRSSAQSLYRRFFAVKRDFAAIPVSLAYAGLAGLPSQAGIYGYLLGGLGYALLGSSRQLAIGPTSAISLMVAGSVGAMAGGDVQRYAEIASLAGFTVAALCLFAWALKLSVLVRL